jgi:hypothetical protein
MLKYISEKHKAWVCRLASHDYRQGLRDHDSELVLQDSVHNGQVQK